jgi:hypothetical protein
MGIECAYSLQPVLGVKWAFDLSMEIGKYLFSESLDGIDTLFLAEPSEPSMTCCHVCGSVVYRRGGLRRTGDLIGVDDGENTGTLLVACRLEFGHGQRVHIDTSRFGH